MRRYLPRVILVLAVLLLVVGACVVRTRPARHQGYSTTHGKHKHKKHVKHAKHKKQKKDKQDHQGDQD